LLSPTSLLTININVISWSLGWDILAQDLIELIK
jgi:hypothetical protein